MFECVEEISHSFLVPSIKIENEIGGKDVLIKYAHEIVDNYLDFNCKVKN